jgi:hypothetical protein
MIPVAHLINMYGKRVGSVQYNVEYNKFVDTNVVVKANLPVQSYDTCEVLNNNIVTVVGKERNNYVVCFGDNYVYSLNKEKLLRYKISNVKFRSDRKIVSTDGKLAYLEDLFKGLRVEFADNFESMQATSLGVTRKFFGKLKDDYCVVKYSKYESEKDLQNEVIYYRLSLLLGVKCCRARAIIYGGRVCAVSVFEYNKFKDVFKSFRQYGSLSSAINALNDEDKDDFKRYLILDYLCGQQDRHLSNLATVNGRLYPLFDNGDCFGLGPIYGYSVGFRKTVESLGVDELSFLVKINKDVLVKAHELLKDNARIKMFDDNYRRLCHNGNVVQLLRR